MGLPGSSPCNLPEAMSEPLKVTRADDHAEDDEDDRGDRLPGAAHDVEVVEDRDQGGGATTDRVEERDQLRHGRHGHAQGQHQAHGATDEEAGHDDDQGWHGEAADDDSAPSSSRSSR